MQKIGSVLLADDHDVIMKGIHQILINHFHVDEIVMLKDSEEVLDAIQKRQFDLYILDLEFNEMSGYKFITEIRTLYPDAKIIINTVHEEIWYINDLLKMDVDGIVAKKSSEQYLQNCIEDVVNGKRFLCPRLAEVKDRCSSYNKKIRSKSSQITPTELQVLRYIDKGLTSKEIASQMCVSENTIETHRKNLILKLNVTNVAQLVSVAIRHRLIE